MADVYKEPIHVRTGRDEEVRVAGLVTGEERPRPAKFPTYEPVLERGLDGKLSREIVQPMFKPDKPGRPVPFANDGPAVAWPGKYPSEERRK